MKTQFNKIENSSVTSNLKAISPQFQFEISPTNTNTNEPKPNRNNKAKPLTIRFCLKIFFLFFCMMWFNFFLYILLVEWLPFSWFESEVGWFPYKPVENGYFSFGIKFSSQINGIISNQIFVLFSYFTFTTLFQSLVKKFFFPFFFHPYYMINCNRNMIYHRSRKGLRVYDILFT